MKSRKEIESKIKELRYEHLEEQIQKRTSRKPENCVYNYLHKTEDGEARLCMLGAEDPDEWGGRFCDTERTAKECPFFAPRKDRGEFESEFDEDSLSAEVAAERFEDIEALRWVIGETELETGLSLIDRLRYLWPW